MSSREDIKACPDGELDQASSIAVRDALERDLLALRKVACPRRAPVDREMVRHVSDDDCDYRLTPTSTPARSLRLLERGVSLWSAPR